MTVCKIQSKHGKKAIILYVLMLICVFFLNDFPLKGAEEDKIVTVKMFVSQDGVHPGGSFKVALLLNIAPGWHINANKLADEFLIPSKLIIEENDNIKVLKLYYPEPTSGRFGYSDVELLIYEREAVLGALIKVSDDISIRKHALKTSFLYQPCNDKSCMLPKTLNVEIPFKIVPVSQKIKEINERIFSKIYFEKEGKKPSKPLP